MSVNRIVLQKQYGEIQLNNFLKEQGIHNGNYLDLTDSEARLLLGAGRLDTARNRIVAARQRAIAQRKHGVLQESSREKSKDSVGDKIDFATATPSEDSQNSQSAAAAELEFNLQEQRDIQAKIEEWATREESGDHIEDEECDQMRDAGQELSNLKSAESRLRPRIEGEQLLGKSLSGRKPLPPLPPLPLSIPSQTPISKPISKPSTNALLEQVKTCGTGHGSVPHSIAFLHNIETIRFVFRRRVLECGGRGRAKSIRFVFGVLATADTALGGSDTSKCPQCTGDSKHSCIRNRCRRARERLWCETHALGATSATALHICHSQTNTKVVGPLALRVASISVK
jgi:hypothetical protein